MPRFHFTARSIAGIETPGKGRVEHWDDTLPGFGLRVSSGGAKTWVLMYRYGGRPRRLTIGSYPRLGLADARDKARAALQEVHKGHDPAGDKQAERRAETFGELATDFLNRYAKQRNRRWKETERIIDRELRPKWRNHKVAGIRRRDVLALIDEIAARPAPHMARGTLAVIRKMYNWAISRDIVEHNPCIAISPPVKARQRDRVLAPDEIVTFWRGLEGAEISVEVKLALKLQLITGQRIGEVITAAWKDIDFSAGIWTIPADRSKNGLAHRVPLTSHARQLLAELRSITGNGRWLFPSPKLPKPRPVQDGATGADTDAIPTSNPMSAGAANRALARNLKSMGMTKFTPHDLRRTAASGMARIGVPRLVISKVLNHVETGVTAIYDRHGYDIEKRDALERWASEVVRLLTEAAGAPDAAAETTLRSHRSY
jgi:integrase